MLSQISADDIFSLLPQCVINFALKNEGMEAPLKQSFHAVVLFAKICGFTELSDSFALKGPQSAEEIAYVLNGYIQQLLRHISKAGGDVFKNRGDALTVLWVPEEKQNKATKEIEEELKHMTHRAIQCSIAIQQELDCAQLIPGVCLSVKIGIDVGEVTVLHVGGMSNRMKYFVSGIPLFKAFDSLEHDTEGNIIVSYEAWEMVSSAFKKEIIVSQTKNKKLQFVRILSQLETIRNKSIQFQKKHILDVLQLRAVLNRYIPPPVFPYLTKNNQKTLQGELRRVSVLFINIGVNLSSINNIDEPCLNWIQALTTGIQNAVYEYEGFINNFLVDDRGTNVIAVFGVPPVAHYDHPIRAFLAASKILRHMKRNRINCFIGVTSGLIYTGLLGCGSSREYSILGDAVNLAAGLMIKQKKAFLPGVIVDRTTQQLIPHWVPVKFDELELFRVKDKGELIHAYAARYTEQHLTHAPSVTHYDIIKYDSQLKNIEKTWKENDNNSMVLMLESPFGTGKSYFLESLTHNLSKHLNVKCVWGKAYPDIARTHFVWKAVFTTLLNKKEYTKNENYRRYVKKLFEQDKTSDLFSYASLANDIFGTRFLETEICSNLTSELRLHKKLDCCLHILKHFSKNERLIIFLDNLQWMQEDEWKVTEFLINKIHKEEIPGVCLFVSSRPLLGKLFRPEVIEPPKEYKRIRDLLQSKGQLLMLKNWSLINIESFICKYFAVDSVHSSLVSYIHEKTGGNPAFCLWTCEQINVKISQKNGVKVLELNDYSKEQREFPLQNNVPAKVQSILIRCIDRLTPPQILALEIASVVCICQGSNTLLFDLETLKQLHPFKDCKKNLKDDLKHLCNINVLSRYTKELQDVITEQKDSEKYLFNCGFLRDVVYESMLLKQREQLHISLSRILEEQLTITSADDNVHNDDV